ncbi:MAG: hypothetical protein LQ340_001222 [Diploschistes diacapsis]|nr:MAG: hypothetical protein LQ340_001222 [Diploschistes diacapsis]
MMAFIHQLIAHIHSEGAISPSIYQFESSDVSAPLRKPPFLHLMSSRIMTALSDAVWKVTEPKLMGDAALVAATYAYKGYEMPGSELNPRVRLLGPEVWLEFILWSCVHGSYFIEAGKLIEHVQRQRGNQEWKTKSWEHIQESLDQKWATVKDPDRVRSWFDRIAGTAEGYSEDPPAASLGERTLSREVVAAIANGLITDNSSGASRHEHLANMWPCLKSCRALAGPPSNPVESLFWNAISNRLFEASHVAGSTSNEVLSRMSSLAEGSEEALDLMNNQEHTSLALEVVESRSPALHPILLHALEQCVRDRDVSNGMVCFGKLKTWADRNLHVLIDNEPPVPQQGTVAFASLTAYLPTHALASLFDFMTEAKLFTFGRMLLPLLDPPRESGIVHGPYLSNSSVLQNSVLRFANATDDRDLEIAVLTRADWKAGQASDDAIRELLHVQLAAGRWDYVESLLIHMQAERKIVLTSVDIARIVSLYLQRPEESLTSIVRSLFLRHYLPPRDYSKSPDYTSFRTLNQMALILLTIREIRPSLLKDCIIRQGQASNPIIIPTDAFNILLWKVVSLYGIQEARNFFKRWCILTPASQSSNNKPTPIIPRNSELDASGAKVIVPNIQTLRIMISPSLKALQSTIPGLDPALVEPGAPNQSVSPAKAYRLTYDAFRKLPQGSRLKANIDWAIHTALRLGLVGHEKYEVLLRQVGRDEVVRGTRRRVAGMGEDAAMEEDEDGLEGEEGLEKGEEGREGVRRKGRWC